MELLLSMVPLHLAAAILKRKTEINSSVAYFTVIMATVMFMYTAALADMLLAATVFCMAAPVALVLYTAAKKGVSYITGRFKEYADIFVLLNILFCVVFTVMFALQKPHFYYWDEFTFWGVSAKYVKCFDRLYSLPVVTIMNSQLPCGNRLLNYLFSFFAAEFMPWHLLASYSYMFFAVFNTAAAVIKEKTDNTPIAVTGFFVLVLMPFMSVFHQPSRNFTSLSYAYGTGMIDFNIGVIFLGVIAAYLSAQDKILYIFPLMFISQVKNTSIFFAALRAAVICCFILFEKKSAGFNIKKAVTGVIITVAAPLIVYAMWSMHFKIYRQPYLKPEYNLKATPPPQLQTQQAEPATEEKMPVEELTADQAPQVTQTDGPGGIISIFVPSMRTQRYKRVLSEMYSLFSSQSITVFGKDKIMVVALILLGALTVVSAEKGKKLSLLFVNAGMAAGAVVYVVVISYFISLFADGMVEYPRYMTSYYFCWLGLGLLLLAINFKEKLFVQLVMVLAAFVTMFDIYKMGISRTVFAAPDNAYEKHINIENEIAPFKEILDKNTRVYLIMPDQDTIGYLHYGFAFLPARTNRDTKGTGIDFTISFREEIDWSSDRTYYNVASPETFGNIMQDYFDYVYVVSPDDRVVRSYSSLFSDGMQTGGFYKVCDGEIPMQRMTFNG